MKFLIGSQNFGLDTANSDKDYFQFVMPELKDLCLPIPPSKNENNTDGSITKHIDIRSLPGLFFKSNLDILQLLYSKEVQDAKWLEGYAKWLKGYFEWYEIELSTINIPRLYQSIMHSATHRFKKGRTKDLAHIIFGFKTIIQFEEQNFKNLRACFEHNDKDFYETVRNGDYNTWFKYAKELEQLSLKKEQAYLKFKPNENFKERMENDFGYFVVTYLSEQKEKTHLI